MTRGRPALWSAAFGAPFVVLGAYVYAFQSQYPLVADQPSIPRVAGLPLVLFGLFVVGLGVYVRRVGTPGEPTMREGERIVAERHPSQRGALLRTGSSVPFLGAGLYLLYFTTHPLVYPTLSLAAGLYLFSTGVHEYWRNTLTTYVLTNRRIVEEYRFVSLVRNEVPLEKVRAVREHRSFVDALFGLGSVGVRAGASGDLSVSVRAIYDSTAFADAIRREMDGPTETEDPEGEGGTASDPEGGTAGVLSWDDVAATEPGEDVKSPPDAFAEGEESVGKPSLEESDTASAPGRESLGDGGSAESISVPEDQA
jgi:hypothetical protein